MDYLIGLVVSVSTNQEVASSIPGTSTILEISSRMASSEPHKDNWVAAWLRSSGYD